MMTSYHATPHHFQSAHFGNVVQIVLPTEFVMRLVNVEKWPDPPFGNNGQNVGISDTICFNTTMMRTTISTSKLSSVLCTQTYDGVVNQYLGHHDWLGTDLFVAFAYVGVP